MEDASLLEKLARQAQAGYTAGSNRERARIVAGIVRKLLVSLPAVNSVELGRYFRQMDCTPSGNKHLLNGAFKVETLGDAVKRLFDHEAMIHNVERGSSYRTSTTLYYNNDSGVRKYLKAHLKETKRIVHYDFCEEQSLSIARSKR